MTVGDDYHSTSAVCADTEGEERLDLRSFEKTGGKGHYSNNTPTKDIQPPDCGNKCQTAGHN